MRCFVTVEAIVKREEQTIPEGLKLKPNWTSSVFLFLCAIGLAGTTPVRAALDFQSPIGFFTNVATRLLRSELNTDLNRIQVYPTNSYTPAVHRLLQVTANLYDATTTNWYPTLYRPLFSADGTNVFITGYEEVNATNEALLTIPLDLSDSASRSKISTNTPVNLHAIPWVIGVKKGIPNFNEVCLDGVFRISRVVQATRPTTNSHPTGYQQQLLMTLSNSIMVEAWNSYQGNFTNPVEVIATGDTTAVLTNTDGVAVTNQSYFWGMVSSNQWAGFGTSPAAASFLVPIRTNIVLLPSSVYNHSQKAFLPNGAAGFEPVPLEAIGWRLNVASHVRVLIREISTKRLLDYVQLDGPVLSRDLSETIRTTGTGFNGLWNTNILVYPPQLPEGVKYQIAISLGNPTTTAAEWNDYSAAPPVSTLLKDTQIAQFRAFYYAQSVTYNGVFAKNATNLSLQLPFTPAKAILCRVDWQANDPLVHHLPSQLQNLQIPSFYSIRPPSISLIPDSNIGKLNDRYQPWGGHPDHSATDQTAFDLSLKDPLIRNTDAWDFPHGEPLSLESLGRIHRGTPWQTVYLKSLDIAADLSGLGNWSDWAGTTDVASLLQMKPTGDSRIVSLLAPLLVTNDVRSLQSLNDPNPSHWLTTLNGLAILTNSSPESENLISSNSPQAAMVVDAINRNRTVRASGYFAKLGDILATPELSVASPWLNTNNTFYQAPSDAAYERLPSQLLSRLRTDSIGTAVPTNQALLLQFTGYDTYPYRLETSSDLVNWSSFATNYPVEGIFGLTMTPTSSAPQFFRSALLIQ